MRSRRGRQARAFGHAFERAVAQILRDRFEDRPWACLVRRTDQAHRAVLPDVHGIPGLWLECQAAGTFLNPKAKLAQAMRDAQRYAKQHRTTLAPMPVAVTRAKGRGQITATLCAADLAWMLERAAQAGHEIEVPVSLSFEAFLAIYAVTGMDSDGIKTPGLPAEEEEAPL